MPLQDTLETFSYFITELDKLGLAYITILRYLDFFDPVIDGKSKYSQLFDPAYITSLRQKSRNPP
jgi:hypothetical protein